MGLALTTVPHENKSKEKTHKAFPYFSLHRRVRPTEGLWSDAYLVFLEKLAFPGGSLPGGWMK